MAYFRRGALVERFTTIATAGAATTLSNNSTTIQYFTGTLDQTVYLPDATTCDGGLNNTGAQKFVFINRSTGKLSLFNNLNNLVAVVPPRVDIEFHLVSSATAAGIWTVSPYVGEQPLKLSAATPATSKINISSNVVFNADGTDTNAPPVSSTIPSLVASTHDLQTGVTTGGVFINAALPTTTIGQFRRFGYSLLASGQIQVIFTPAAPTLAATANAGTVFVSSGIPIGWVDVVATAANAFKTAGSAANIIENIVAGVSCIHRFGSGGGGGGSGTGNANSFLEGLKRRLDCAPFQSFSENILATSGSTRIDPTSTGTYDIANGVYALPTIGNKLLSVQSYLPGFLTNFDDSFQAELHALWTLIDLSAVYRVSRDGGLNWNPITIVQAGVSNLARGITVFAEPVIKNALSIYDVTNAVSTKSFDVATQQKQAIRFVLTSKQRLSDLRLFLNKLGAPAGRISIAIINDVSGFPSTLSSDRLIETSLPVTTLAAGNLISDLNLTKPLLPGTYWLTLEGDSFYQSSYSAGINELRLRTDNVSPVGTSALAVFNGTSWSIVAGEQATYRIQGTPYDLRYDVTSGTVNVSLQALAIFSEEDSQVIPADVEELQIINVNGNLDTTVFQITNFNVNPQKLKVYDSDNDAVYRFGKFVINGNQVIFPSGTFLAPGKNFKLLFEQDPMSRGGTSDKLAAVFAANGLGSSDPAFDFSAPGVGLKLRSADGTKWLVVVLNSGAIQTVLNGW